MADQDVLFVIDNTVATITLNRPARHNALTLEMLQAIDHALAAVEASSDVRVLQLRTTSSRFFCSGADINGWGDIDAEHMGSRFIRAGNRVFRRLAELDIPTLCVLSGSALGGGLELALACDLRYAAEHVTLGFPEAAVGAIPGWMGCQRLGELVGPSRARELVLTGEAVEANKALMWGLINAVAAADQLDALVQQVTRTLGSRSTVSMSVAKRLLRSCETRDAQVVHELAASVCKATPDAVEGVRAFREKRPARF